MHGSFNFVAIDTKFDNRIEYIPVNYRKFFSKLLSSVGPLALLKFKFW